MEKNNTKTLQIDTVMYVSGAILWAVDKENTAKNGMQKLVGTSLYKKMTVRNVILPEKYMKYEGAI